MHKESEFGRFHPVVNFIFFITIIGFSMFIMHPLYQAIALLLAFIYSMLINGKKAIVFNLAVLLPLIVTTALINPLFNHEGITVLGYFPSGNPLTAESVIYGISAGVMLATVVCIFSAFNKVMTTDKLICIFGKVVPSLSLIFSMILRFVPRFKAHLMSVRKAQKDIGRDITDGNVIAKAKQGMAILSSMTTWSLENAIDTSYSMKSRGYGLSGRTSYSIYNFQKRDFIFLSVIVMLTLVVIIGKIYGYTEFQYFPMIRYKEISPCGIGILGAYLLLYLIPVIIEAVEVIRWKR